MEPAASALASQDPFFWAEGCTQCGLCAFVAKKKENKNLHQQLFFVFLNENTWLLIRHSITQQQEFLKWLHWLSKRKHL